MGVVVRRAAVWLAALLTVLAAVTASALASAGTQALPDGLARWLPAARGPAPAHPAPAGTAAPDPAATADGSGRRAHADRLQQVTDLLDRRAAALLARDRDGFLADLDPAAVAFLARQQAVFDALAEVPLATWEYEVEPGRAGDPRDLAQRHGGAVWVPQVSLRYGFHGVPGRPTVAAQVLTFVQRDGRWLLASDSDLDDGPVRTARALWDTGPVAVVRGRHALVLGHPESRPSLSELAEEVDAAVPRVTAAWGVDWAQQVVVVLPRDEEEMRLLVGEGLELGEIAAVATAQLAGGPDRYEPVGDRVVVHPGNYPRLGALGRRIVLTHEVVHVAARQASGPALPAWLAEGFADHVAYADAGVPLERAAPRTARAVRAGDLPDALPAAEDFAGPEIARAYEEAWLAVGHLADSHGGPALLQLYRRIGAAPPGADAERVVADAFAEVLGETPAAFTAEWRDDLRRAFR